jgi:hypothetical protein
LLFEMMDIDYDDDILFDGSKRKNL